ncbi:MAG: iron-containing redox enzyme family protein [Thaumarchaeota archaeon]|nr:iron-containing redox enzyme family protein [Nitrososphaerota archaeon]
MVRHITRFSIASKIAKLPNDGTRKRHKPKYLLWVYFYDFGMSEVTDEFEVNARRVTEEQIKAVVPRDLLPNGAYAPVNGIYDIGWKEWMNLPYADFAREMRDFDDSVIRENREWILRLAPMIEKGELSKEEIRLWELENFLTVDSFPIKIASHVFHNLQNREVKDIILRHTSEEVGHGELKADFLVQGFGMDRVRDIWNGKQLVSRKANFADANPKVEELGKISPALAYATVPFAERSLPMLNQIMGRALRKQYHFPDSILGFYDLHTYVDIYHERLGLYVMAKYGGGKKGQELFRDSVETIRRDQAEIFRAGYDAMKAQ